MLLGPMGSSSETRVFVDKTLTLVFPPPLFGRQHKPVTDRPSVTMYGFGKGFGKGKGFQTDDWRGSYKGGKGYVPWNGGGGFTPRWNNQGQGSSDVKELTAMFKANMEKEQWKEEKKEWGEYEKKQREEREERERKRVDEMERFKEEMRTQSATAAKEMV